MQRVKLSFSPAMPAVRHRQDIARMIRVMNARGYRVPGPHLQMLWDEYGEVNSHYWCPLPERDDVLEMILLGGLGVIPLPKTPGFYFPRRWHLFYKATK